MKDNLRGALLVESVDVVAKARRNALPRDDHPLAGVADACCLTCERSCGAREDKSVCACRFRHLEVNQAMSKRADTTRCSASTWFSVILFAKQQQNDRFCSQIMCILAGTKGAPLCPRTATRPPLCSCLRELLPVRPLDARRRPCIMAVSGWHKPEHCMLLRDLALPQDDSASQVYTRPLLPRFGQLEACRDTRVRIVSSAPVRSALNRSWLERAPAAGEQGFDTGVSQLSELLVVKCRLHMKHHPLKLDDPPQHTFSAACCL